MGRRSRGREPGLAEVVVDLAWANPLVGAGVSVVFLVVASVIETFQGSHATPLDIVRPLIGMLLGIIGFAGLIVSAVGFVRDAFVGRR